MMPAHTVRRETRLRVYNTFAIPMLTYGCEVWALKKSDKRRITAVEMKFLRRSAGYTLLDKKRNEVIQEELGVTPIIKKITEYRKKWRNHVDRMHEDRSPRIMHEFTPEGKRSRGRPRRKLEDTSGSSGHTTPQTGQLA